MKNIKYIVIALLMAISLSFVTEHTYAYFATSINAPANQDITGTIMVGSWQSVTAPAWDPNASYNTGDQVEYQGSVYEAIKSSKGKEPTGRPNSTNFWTLVS
jgi:chitodextrinase